MALIETSLARTWEPGANMGNIFGDAWRYVKKDPLILAPPLWLGKETIKYGVPLVVNAAKDYGGAVVQGAQALRPAQPAPTVDPLTAALMGGNANAPGSSSGPSMLPIVLGAGALGVVLLLVLGKKKKT